MLGIASTYSDDVLVIYHLTVPPLDGLLIKRIKSPIPDLDRVVPIPRQLPIAQAAVLERVVHAHQTARGVHLTRGGLVPGIPRRVRVSPLDLLRRAEPKCVPVPVPRRDFYGAED